MMKKLFLLVGVVGLAFILLGVKPGSSLAQEKGKSGEPFVIGYIGNFSWPFAADASYAVDLAAEEINKAGGLLGRQVQVAKIDSKGQAPIAVAGYKQLIMNKGAKAVILGEGAELNFACQAAGAELYPEFPHLCFNATTSHEGLGLKVLNEYNKYKFYFRTFINTDLYRKGIMDWGRSIKRLMNPKTAALIIEDAQWTEYFRNGKAGLYPPCRDDMEKETGIKVVYYAEISVREKMFLPLFQALADKNPEWICYVSAYSDVTTFVKQWAVSPAKNIDLWDGGGPSTMPGFWGMSGGAALGLVTPIYSRAALSDKTIPFVDDLKKRYNKDSNWVAFGSYDSVYMIKAAMEKTKTADIEALIKALESIEMTGVYGIIKYDNTHTCKFGWPYMDFPYGEFQHGGELVIVHPENVAKATNPTKPYIPVKQLRQQ